MNELPPSNHSTTSTSMTSDPDKMRFAQAALRAGYDLSRFKAAAGDGGTNELIRKFDERVDLNKAETKAARHKFFGIPGTKPEDFSELLIEIEADKSVLVGIRHMNLNSNSPYLEVWPNWLPTNEEEVRKIASRITEHFSSFRPKHLCLWLDPTGSLLQDLAPRSIIGQHILARPIADIVKSPQPLDSGRLTIERIADESFYDDYAKAYADFHQEFPELKARVAVVDLEDMRQSIADDLLFGARYNGEYSGLIAAQREQFLGYQGVYFLELLLLPRFKKMGLAPVLQRSFIDRVAQLGGYRDAVVWGTIDSHNLPSLRTALRVGRKIVSTECFYRID
jgi:hypothetical protein